MEPIMQQEGGNSIDGFVFDETEQYSMFAEIVFGDKLYYTGFLHPCAQLHFVGYDKWSDEMVVEVKKFLQQDIDRYIPKESQGQIKWVLHPPSPMGSEDFMLNGTVAWKTIPVRPEKFEVSWPDEAEDCVTFKKQGNNIRARYG